MAIQTIKATMQMRRGAEENFDPDQMTAGEWAVSMDSKKVWMCFAPGIVRRMATYEAFEQDMVDIQMILATCRDIQVAVERFEQLAEQHASQAEEWSAASKSWAVGGTGTREGEDTNNSQYWSQQSKTEADRAKNEADRAAAIADIDIDSELSEISANPVQNRVVTGELNKKLNKDGDATYTSAIFEKAGTRNELLSGDNLGTLFGKINKWLYDLKLVSFSGSYMDLANRPDIPSITNSLLATKNGTALDAVQGKVLDDSKQDKATAINTSNIGSQSVHYADSAGSVNWNNIIGRPSIANAVTTVTTETKRITINASSILSVDLSFSPPIGFSAIGVVAVNSNTASSAITRFMIISNNVRIELRNMTSGQQNITISASVLCKNNG